MQNFGDESHNQSRKATDLDPIDGYGSDSNSTFSDDNSPALEKNSPEWRRVNEDNNDGILHRSFNLGV